MHEAEILQLEDCVPFSQRKERGGMVNRERGSLTVAPSPQTDYQMQAISPVKRKKVNYYAHSAVCHK
jgi:hypothetical protein